MSTYKVQFFTLLLFRFLFRSLEFVRLSHSLINTVLVNSMLRHSYYCGGGVQWCALCLIIQHATLRWPG